MPRHEDREIIRLAVPAFFALVAEPLFLLADAAIVGHLGTAQLAGLGVAAAVLHTVVGLCVFLAFGTTAAVARHLGADDRRGALSQGLDGIWLAVGIGTLTTVAGVAATTPLVSAFGAGDEVSGYAETYLRIAFLGTTPLLVMLAATGVLRGLQDTRTPLRVAIAGNALNIVLNLALVYGAGLGIAGSAIGSVLAQFACAAALVAVVVRGARRERLSLRPHAAGIMAAAHAAVPLVIRTITLRAALLLTVWLVATGSTTDVATHQLAMTIWSFLAFVLDAIAIAAQAITGRHLGAGNVAATRAITRRMMQWGLVSGVVLGLAIAAVSPLLGYLFTGDPDVRQLLTPVLLVAALFLPIAGLVFVLDGVLIGAGDGRYLAWAGLASLVAYTPLAVAATYLTHDLVWIWVTFAGGFMAARAAVLVHRERGTAWLVTGIGSKKRWAGRSVPAADAGDHR